MPRVLYCVGAQKAGTTWLFQMLRRSAQVSFPLRKEAHYWDWVGDKKRPRQDREYWDQLRAGTSLWVADFTPDYAVIEEALIAAAVDQQPTMQVIFLMRDPVARAWSAARMAMDYARLKDEEASDDWLAAVALSQESQRRGDYANTIRSWRNHLPPEQFHVFGYVDIQQSPKRLLSKICEILSIDDVSAAMNDNQVAKRFNAGRRRTIPDRLHTQLQELYAPKISDLRHCLKHFEVRFDLNTWSAL